MFRNTSEEILIRSFVDGSMGAATPGIDNMGFLATPSSIRVNSEELFNSWIANSESSGFPLHIRQPQASRKMSNELYSLIAQQHGAQQLFENTQFQGSTIQSDHNSNAKARNTNSLENKKNQQDYPSLQQTLSWFQSSQPMTRSRSTELRRRYLEMQRQSAQGFPPTSLQPQNKPGQNFPPSPNTLSNTSDAPRDTVSTVVNMLKGSLERKKLSARSSNTLQHMMQNGDTNLLYRVNGQQPQQQQQQQQSPSESSGGGDNSCPTTPNHLNLFHDGGSKPLEQPSAGNYPSPSSYALSSDIQSESIQMTEHQKRQAQLSRAGSITSSGRSGLNYDVSSDNSTKKRRVERKRMMVEAKGRSSVPMMPSDMQAAIKRCEALEKEVRSLKLNLSFMNRKDSEQTKRIEELEAQNEELLHEKCKLAEELDHLRTW